MLQDDRGSSIASSDGWFMHGAPSMPTRIAALGMLWLHTRQQALACKSRIRAISMVALTHPTGAWLAGLGSNLPPSTLLPSPVVGGTCPTVRTGRRTSPPEAPGSPLQQACVQSCQSCSPATPGISLGLQLSGAHLHIALLRRGSPDAYKCLRLSSPKCTSQNMNRFS